jgi:hypothetical protein
MTSRNYTRPTAETTAWAETRETHPAVAAAIHAIASDKRSAEAIWEAPTHIEWDHVAMAVEEYVVNGDFPAEDDGLYQWGQETIECPRDAR